MFELLLVGAAIFFGGIYLFKFAFFLLGFVLTGVGFAIKAVITVILALLFFPVTILFAGGIMSSGIIGVILLFALLGALGRRTAGEARYY